MSRAPAAKTGGADKTKPPASQTPVIAQEIVPGKFNDNDWNSMVDRDGTDEFIHDIMDELMENTMKAIYEKYIERQLLPFTITQAREAMVEIIEWRFLANDNGEQDIDTDLGWAEDEEPEPAVTDCWAQGSVPRNLICAPTPPLEDIAEEADQEKEEAEAAVEVPEEAPQEPPELADYVSDTEEAPQEAAPTETAEEDTKELKEAVSKSSTKKSSKTKFRPYRGKIKSAGVSKMTESLEETEMKMICDEIAASMPPSDDKPSTLLNMPASCTSILKVQTGRPPGNKDVVYDDLGNVIAVMKLDPEKLPNHKIVVKYHVVDPAVEAAQARLDAMRKGKSTGSKKKSRANNKASSDSQATNQSQANPSKSRTAQPSAAVAPLPPPLKNTATSKAAVGDMRSVERVTKGASDSESKKQEKNPRKNSREEHEIHGKRSPTKARIEEMEVAHGVIVREGGRVKKGPGRYYGKFDILEESQKGMKPISIHLTNPDITVGDLLDRHTPILRPLGDTSPLPPIVPHPPPQQSQQV